MCKLVARNENWSVSNCQKVIDLLPTQPDVSLTNKTLQYLISSSIHHKPLEAIIKLLLIRFSLELIRQSLVVYGVYRGAAVQERSVCATFTAQLLNIKANTDFPLVTSASTFQQWSDHPKDFR